jgi:hypothetical protein
MLMDGSYKKIERKRIEVVFFPFIIEWRHEDTLLYSVGNIT